MGEWLKEASQKCEAFLFWIISNPCFEDTFINNLINVVHNIEAKRAYEEVMSKTHKIEVIGEVE